MYTYVDTLAVEKSVGSTWNHYDTKNVMLRQVYGRFSKAIVIVHDSYTDKEMYVNMMYYVTTLATSEQTVGEWLADMNGLPLNTVPELPNADYKYAEYANAVLHGYKIMPAWLGRYVPDNYPVADMPDLRLTRPRLPTNMELLHTHCLLSVNGYFHQTDATEDEAYIIQGGTTATMMRCSHTGILSFMGIGAVKKHPWRKEQIIPLNPDGKLKDGMLLRTDVDLTNKSVFMVLGGYIVPPQEGVFYQNGDQTFVFQLKGIPYVQRYFNSYKELDMSSMNVIRETNGVDAEAINQESLWSDEVITQFMMLSQSFLVVVDSPEIFFEHFNVRVSNLPGFLTSYQEPKWPLIMGYGKHVEYSKVKEYRWWALRVQDPYYKHFAFNSAILPTLKTISDNLMPYNQAYFRTTGYLLKIGGVDIKKRSKKLTAVL